MTVNKLNSKKYFELREKLAAHHTENRSAANLTHNLTAFNPIHKNGRITSENVVNKNQLIQLTA